MTSEQQAALADVESYLAKLQGQPVTTGADPFVIRGYALRWDSTALGKAGPTRFARSAFGENRLKVPLLWQHEPDKVVGTALLTPDHQGLHVEARVVPTTLGADALALLRAGALDAFSIGFTTATSRREGGVRLVTRATVEELSLVTFPADRAARVSSVGGEPVAAQFHAAAPVERLSPSAQDARDAMREVRDAERELRALLGQAEPGSARVALERFDWLRGRSLSPEEDEVRQRGARLQRLHQALQRDPRLARMETNTLMEYVKVQHQAEMLSAAGHVREMDRVERLARLRTDEWAAR